MRTFRISLSTLLVFATLSAIARADEDDKRDLGLVFFDEWPRGLPALEDGIPVRWAVPKSPAGLAGFKPGDVILNLDLFMVSKEDLPKRWTEKSRGAAGCIDMTVLRTELKPKKAWHNMTLCVPVGVWEMPADAEKQAQGQVQLAVVSGGVENPGTYLLALTPLPDVMESIVSTGSIENVCVTAVGPDPLPPAECGSVMDPKWKKFPKNRSYKVVVNSKAAEETPPAKTVPGTSTAP